MSAIKEGGYPVKLKGKEYKLLFSLNALDEIQDRYGGYDKMAELFREENKDWVKDTKWLLTLLINEGLLYEDEQAALLTPQQVGRMVNTQNIGEIQTAIFASFSAGIIGDEEIESEEEGNLRAVQGK